MPGAAEEEEGARKKMNNESSALTMSSPAVVNQCARGGMEEEKVWPKQQQQNNFSLFPSTKGWNFRGKKRKQSTQDEDTISICSLDTSEPSNKRVKPLSRVTSLASLIPPVRATPLKRFSQTLQMFCICKMKKTTIITTTSKTTSSPGRKQNKANSTSIQKDPSNSIDNRN